MSRNDILIRAADLTLLTDIGPPPARIAAESLDLKLENNSDHEDEIKDARRALRALTQAVTLKDEPVPLWADAGSKASIDHEKIAAETEAVLRQRIDRAKLRSNT